MVIWKRGIFERYVIKNWRIVCEHLCMNPETGALTWRKKRGR